MSLISIVVPTHNERDNVEVLHRRIAQVFASIDRHDFELIFCDDSDDDTPAQILRLNKEDPRVKMIRLSRRFGQAVALSAGIDRCSGEAVILMDADLQDPPETIPELIGWWEQGHEVVYVQRDSSSEYVLYGWCARLFYRLLRRLSSVSIPVDSGEFRLMDRKVVDFLRQLKEHTRYLRGLTLWPGLRQVGIRIDRPARTRGKTNYNFLRSLLVATDGIVSFSVAPLRLAVIAGVVVAVLSFLLGVTYIVYRLFQPSLFGAGWTSLFVAIFFMGGVQLVFLGILGEYIGRIFIEVQARPLYWVEFDVGFQTAAESNQMTRQGLR